MINVLNKADQILRCLGTEIELTASELAERLREPRTSVYRLLESMEELGWVRAGHRKGAYRVGLQLFRIGASATRDTSIRDVARPIMGSLLEETGNTVFLCIRDGYEALCIERLDGTSVQTFELVLGGTLPLHVGAGPLALLAFTPELWDEYMFRAPLNYYTEQTANTPERLRAALQKTVERGYAVSDQDVATGIAAVGAPVFDHDGQVVAALSVSGIAAVLLGRDRDRHITIVREAAAQLSARLGHRSEEELHAVPDHR